MHTLEQLYSGELKGTKHLKVSCDLTEFPEEIFSLADSLEILDLSKNKLSNLPQDLKKLFKLKILFLSENLFTEMPKVLSDCKHLEMIGFKSNQIEFVFEESLPPTTRWLILTDNLIKKLPASIGNCTRLQKVALAGNQLTELPLEMAQCKNLELLRISANNFKTLPQWLLNMPKLSWLAFAGNPFSETKAKSTPLAKISWNEFEITEQLGEGASGHIYKALWKNNSDIREVAIKVFKGEVTSDGFPEDEMKASIFAGTHPQLVNLIGEIKDHPQKKQGLIMSLISREYKNLGMPPDFDTCSRDTFKAGTYFSGGQILKIAISIASCANHLHSKGINHGDLYAHNILIDKDANSLMGDFGAASFYNKDSANAKKIQQIEARAFGCLLDDLLIRISPDEKDLKLIEELSKIKNSLMQIDIDSRPLFDEALIQLQQRNSDK